MQTVEKEVHSILAQISFKFLLYITQMLSTQERMGMVE